jgi:hypothetical protein
VGETTRINWWTVSIGLERLVKEPVSARFRFELPPTACGLLASRGCSVALGRL